MDAKQEDFLGTFDERWDDYRKQFKAARSDISEDSIHDLRVAARRSLALLDILRSLAAHAHARQLRRFLKGQLDQLDELRDAQVMLADTAQTMEKLPQLVPFEAYLMARLKDLGGRARKHIRSSKPSDLKERVKTVRSVAKKHADDEDLLDKLLSAVDKAHARVVKRFGKLNQNDPATIHRVRVAFKNFRYMIETIQPLLKGYPTDYLDRMHDYQDAMGRVHDTTVFLDRLHEFEQSLPKLKQGAPPAFDRKPIEAYYRKRLDDLIQAYFERKDEFNTFWRAAPDQPFPWEKSHDSVHRASRNRRPTEQHQQRRTRQPAASDRQGAEEVPAGGARSQAAGSTDRPRPDQPVPPGG